MANARRDYLAAGKGMIRRRALASSSILAVAMCTAPVAVAQDTAPAAGDKPIEKVVVTARKRSEDVQKVPVSVTAISGDEVNARNATRVRDLQGAAPNVYFPNSENNSLTRTVVRGIESQSRQNVGTESGMSVYVDGVVLGRMTAFNQEMNDVARIEFLRGPQGTLFGKNAVSGAMNIITRSPSLNEVIADAQVRITELNGHYINGFATAPIVEDVLGASLAGFWLERDGYIENLAQPGKELGAQEAQGGRAKFLYQPIEELKIVFSADMLYDTSVSPSFQRTVGPGATPGIFTTSLNTPPTTRRQVAGSSVTADYDIGGATITSITAYREANDDRTSDLDVGPVATQTTVNNSDQNQFSQELRIASSEPATVEYVAGLYFYRQDIFGSTTANLSATITPFIAGTIETDAWAAFANVDWHILDDLTLTGGIRYTVEEKELAFRQDGDGAFPNLPFQVDNQEDDDVSPTVSLTWQVSPDAMIYGTVGKGFRSGGWNVEPNATATITSFTQLRFGPESVLSYEAGAKTSWLNDRLFLNAAVFFMQYDDLQVTSRTELPPPAPPGTFAAIVTNAGAAEAKGFEMEMRWKMFEGFLLSGALGYVETEYTRYTDNVTSFAGKSLNYAPEWTGNVSGQYDFSVGFGTVRLRADYNYIGDFFTERTNDPRQSVDAYSIVNGRIAFTHESGLFDVALFGNNLTDNVYYISRSSNVAGTVQSVDYGMPRVVGLEVSVHY